MLRHRPTVQCVVTLLDDVYAAKEDVVVKLRKLADELDAQEKDMRIAKTGFASSGVLGGVLAIAGLIAAPFTFGISAILGIAGAVVGVPSALGAIATEIADGVINSNTMKEAKSAADNYKEKAEELSKKVEHLKSLGIAEDDLKQMVRSELATIEDTVKRERMTNVLLCLLYGAVVGHDTHILCAATKTVSAAFGKGMTTAEAVTEAVSTAEKGFTTGETAAIAGRAVARGETVAETATIAGKVAAAGETVAETAATAGKVAAAGETVAETAAIAGKITAAGETVAETAAVAGKVAAAGETVAETAAIAGKVAAAGETVAETAAAAGKVAGAAGKVAQVLKIGGFVLTAVTIPLDIYTIVNNSIKIHNNTPSEIAEKIRHMANEIEQQELTIFKDA